MSGKFYHNIFLSHCTLERKVVGDILDNQISVSGWFRVLRLCLVVWYISLEQFFYALWLLVSLLFWYVFKCGFVLSLVGQWCAGISPPRSPFFWVTWLQCLCDVFWESILISMGFQTYDGRSILVSVAAPLLCIFRCVVLVKTYFPWLFSRGLYKHPESQGLEVPYLKQCLGIVSVSGISSLLG